MTIIVIAGKIFESIQLERRLLRRYSLTRTNHGSYGSTTSSPRCTQAPSHGPNGSEVADALSAYGVKSGI